MDSNKEDWRMKYMVEIKLPRYKNQHFMSLIPEQRDQIAELMGKNVIDMFSLNTDRTKLWMIVNGTSSEEIHSLVEEFHLYRYMRVKVELLSMFDSQSYRLPPLVLN